jgi:hypothetical protein
MLDENGVYYKQQVTIDKCGIIVGFNERKRGCFHILDFVIGENIEIGKSITEYKVVSCKTTQRKMDTGRLSHMFKPILYILLTLSDDYPRPVDLEKTKKNNIVYQKKRDDRIYKLNFENLIEELL